METLHHSRRLLRLGLHTFWGWVYLVQIVRFTLLIFWMGRLIVLEFDDCIYVAEATTVDTFALDVTMYFAKLPYFGQL